MFLLIFHFLLFVLHLFNIFNADDKYASHNRGKLLLPFRMHLSKKHTFCTPFTAVFESALNFEHFQPKKESASLSQSLWNYWLWKTWLFKGIEYSISENPSTVNVLTTCSRLLYNGFLGGTLANLHAVTECHTRKRSSCFCCQLGVKAVIVISFLFLDCDWKQHVFLYFN